MKIRFLMCFLVGCLSAATTLAESGSTRIDAFLKDVQSLSSDFDQTLFDENLKALERSSGRLFIARPGRFRWDYATPYPQAIVSDGKKLWVYDSELEQVTVKSIDSTLDDTPAVLLTSAKSLEDSFLITESSAASGTAWVELKPRSKEAAFSMVRLGFAGSDLQIMEMTDNFGQLTKLQFTHVVKNPKLDEAMFDFSPPPGVDVIGE